MDIGCQRGIRHELTSIKGQRTKNNSRTRKGKRKLLLTRKSNQIISNNMAKTTAKNVKLLLNLLGVTY